MQFRRKYQNYDSAKAYAKKYGVKSEEHWVACIKGEIKDVPSARDLPIAPDTIYKEWKNWDDFLNKKGNRKTLNNRFDFEQAKIYLSQIHIKNSVHWRLWAHGKLEGLIKFPKYLPKKPNKAYKEDWKGWQDFLGTEKKEYKNYKQAKEFVRSLQLKSLTEWKEYKKGKREDLPPYPHDLPRVPDEFYKRKNTWKGWLDFIGSGKISHGYSMPFGRARNFVQSLRLKSKRDYRAYVTGTSNRLLPAVPKDLPRVPNKVYENKWLGWGDFLGTGRKEAGIQKYRSFEKARTFVRSLKIKTEGDWLLYTKGKLKGYDLMPKDIPMRPNSFYKEKWNGYNDFLGNGKQKGKIHPTYLSYKEAREFSLTLHLKSSREWRKYALGRLNREQLPPIPLSIPKNPFRSYQNKGWISWGDFLGY